MSGVQNVTNRLMKMQICGSLSQGIFTEDKVLHATLVRHTFVTAATTTVERISTAIVNFARRSTAESVAQLICATVATENFAKSASQWKNVEIAPTFIVKIANRWRNAGVLRRGDVVMRKFVEAALTRTKDVVNVTNRFATPVGKFTDATVATGDTVETVVAALELRCAIS